MIWGLCPVAGATPRDIFRQKKGGGALVVRAHSGGLRGAGVRIWLEKGRNREKSSLWRALDAGNMTRKRSHPAQGFEIVGKGKNACSI